MPGTFTHLYLAGKFLSSNQKIISQENYSHFLFGSIFPDIGYFLGNNPLISNLSHYVGSSLFPKKVHEFSESEEWKAFSLGWLLHVHTDIVGHPFVNQMAAKIVESNKKEITYEEDILLHARVENSLDRLVLKKFLNLIYVQINFPKIEKENPLTKAIKEIYGIDFGNVEIENSIRKIPFQLRSFYRLQKWIFKKNLVVKLLKIFINLQTQKKREATLSVMEDVQISKDIFSDYLKTITSVLEKWLIDKSPAWPNEQYNLDTGRIAKEGNYKLADEVFNSLNEKKNYTNKYWQQIAAEFLQE